MNDDQIQALAAAVREMLDARDIQQRTQVADLRATVEALQSEVQDLRAKVAVLPAEMHAASARMVQTLGASLGAACPTQCALLLSGMSTAW
jgi:uncharacterized protein YlxW (UPF0749 family)